MKRNCINLNIYKQSGITLIALIVTIVVLIILAGVTIGILAGDNGILTKAKIANTANAYYSAEELVKLAYTAVNAEIITQKTSDVNYNALSEGNIQKLLQIIENQLSGNEWNVSFNNDKNIYISYTNASMNKEAIKEGIRLQDGKIDYAIILAAQEAILLPVIEIDYGNMTKDTIGVGQDLKIAGEKFRVMKKDDNTIIAVPFYNITLSDFPQQSSSTPKIKFSTGAYWGNSLEVDMNNSQNCIQKYIVAYSNKLNAETGGCVTARVARYDELFSITGDNGKTANQIRNPTQKNGYWIGTAGSRAIAYAMGSAGTGVAALYPNLASSYVRPLIVIDI